MRLAVSLTLMMALLAPAALTAQERGSVTNLPLPRYVSLKAGEGNVRRGPSMTHRIDWVFKRRNLPLEVTAEHGHWRRVRDMDGIGGWIHYSLLSGARTAIVTTELSNVYSLPDTAAHPVAQLEGGVVARIEECQPNWCRLSAGGYKGWAPKSDLWGVGDSEILN